MMDTIKVWFTDLSLLVIFFSIAVELTVALWKRLALYDGPEFLVNLLANLFQQMGRRFIEISFLLPYPILLSHLAIARLPWTWYNLLLGFIVFDFVYYWVHRMRHRVSLLWAEHVVHHQPRYFNVSVGIRLSVFHGFNVLWMAVPMAVIGFDGKIVVTLVLFEMIYQMLIHTELVKNFGIFDAILNSPSHHRVHHGANPSYIDKNYGGTLIIWDRIFGTFAEETEPVRYGLDPQIESSNLFVLNTFGLRELFRDFRSSRNWKEAVGSILGPPGRSRRLDPPSQERPVAFRSRSAARMSSLAFIWVIAIYICCLFVTTRWIIDSRTERDGRDLLEAVVIFACMILLSDSLGPVTLRRRLMTGIGAIALVGLVVAHW